MKNRQRLLSLLMCFLMIFTSLPTAAFASVGDDVERPAELPAKFEYLVSSGGAVTVTHGEDAIEHDMKVLIDNDNSSTVVETVNGKLELPELDGGYYEVTLALLTKAASLLPYSESSLEIYYDDSSEVFFADDAFDVNRAQLALKADDVIEGASIQFVFDDETQYVNSIWTTSSGNYMRIEELELGRSGSASGQFRLINDSEDASFACSEWIDFEWSETDGFVFNGEVYNFENHIDAELHEKKHVLDYSQNTFSSNMNFGSVRVRQINGDFVDTYPIGRSQKVYLPELPTGNYKILSAVYTDSDDLYTADMEVWIAESSALNSSVYLEREYNGETVTFEYQLKYEDHDGIIKTLNDTDIPFIVDGEMYDDDYADSYVRETHIAKDGFISIDLAPGEYELYLNEESYRYDEYIDTKNMYCYSGVDIEVSEDGTILIEDESDLTLDRAYFVVEAEYPDSMEYDVAVDAQWKPYDVDFEYSSRDSFKMEYIDWDGQDSVETNFRIFIEDGRDALVDSEWINIRVEKDPYKVFVDDELIDHNEIYRLPLREAAFEGEIDYDADMIDEIESKANEAYGEMEFDFPDQFVIVVMENDEVVFVTQSRGNDNYYLPELPDGEYTVQAFDPYGMFKPSTIAEFTVDGSQSKLTTIDDLSFNESNLYTFGEIWYMDEDGSDRIYTNWAWYSIYKIDEDGHYDEVFYGELDEIGLFIPQLEDGEYEIDFDYRSYEGQIMDVYEFEVVNGEPNTDFVMDMIPVIAEFDMRYECDSLEIDIESDKDLQFRWVGSDEDYYLVELESEDGYPVEGRIRFFDTDDRPDGSSNWYDFLYDGSTFTIGGEVLGRYDEYSVRLNRGNIDGRVLLSDGEWAHDGKVYFYALEPSEDGPVLIDYTYVGSEGGFKAMLDEGDYLIVAEVGGEDGELSDVVQIRVDENYNVYQDGEELDDIIVVEIVERIDNPTTVKGQLKDGGIITLDDDVWICIESIDNREEEYLWDKEFNTQGQIELPELPDGEYEYWVFPDLPEWIAFESRIEEFTVENGVWSIDKDEIVLNSVLYGAEFKASIDLGSDVRFEIDADGFGGMGTSSSSSFIRIEEIHGDVPMEGKIRAICVGNDMPVVSTEWKNFTFDGETLLIEGQDFDHKNIGTWLLPDAQVKGLVHAPNKSDEVQGHVNVYQNGELINTEEIRDERNSDAEEDANVFFLGNLATGTYIVQVEAVNSDELEIEELSSTATVVIGLDGKLMGDAPVLTFESAPQGEDTEAPEIFTTLKTETVSEAQYSFEYEVTDNRRLADVAVFLNGDDLKLSDPNAKVIIDLEPGENIFKIYAVDTAGNETTVEVTVTYNKPVAGQPTIKFTSKSPTNMPITAWVEDGDKIIEMKIGDGEWQRIASYTVTENTTISARAKEEENDPWSLVTTAQVTWIDTEKPVVTTDLKEGVVNASELTFNFKATDNAGIKSVEIEFDGKEYTPDASGNVTVTLEEGENIINIMVVDTAGNYVGFSTEVELDSKAPEVELIYSTKDSTNRDVYVSYEVNEEFVVVSGDSYHIFKSNGTHEFVVRDLAGNETKATAQVNWIDKAAPDMTSAELKLNGSELNRAVRGGEVVELSLEFNEDVKAEAYVPGITESVQLTKADGVYKWTWSVPTDLNQSVEIEVRARDNAGNVTTEKAGVVEIDNKAPALSAVLSNDTKRIGNYIVSETAEIIVKSSASLIQYGTSEDALTQTVGEDNIITLNGEGKNDVEEMIYIQATDAAGNKSEIKAIPIPWDTVAPAKPVVNLEDDKVNTSIISLTGTSEDGKVIIYKPMRSRKVAVAYATAETFAEGVDLRLREGSNTFYIVTKDAAGNVSEETQVVINADFTSPLLNIAGTDDEGKVVLTSNENLSNVEVKINDGDWTSLDDIAAGEETTVDLGTLESGDNQIIIRGADEYGNIGHGRFTKLIIEAGEKIEDKAISEDITLAEGSFTENTVLSVATVDVEAEEGKNFVSEPIDFTLDGSAEIEDYIIVNLEIGSGYSDATKLYYHDEESDVWLPLDKSEEHGDSIYNSTDSDLTHAFTSPSGKKVEVTVAPGDLVAMLLHFSTYGAQDDETAPEIEATHSIENDITSESEVAMDVTVSEAVDVQVMVNDQEQKTVELTEDGTLTVTLEEGENTVQLIATDKAGNVSADNPSFEIELDSTKPEITMSTDSEELTKEDTAVFEILATDSNFAYVTINENGEITEMASRTFEVELDLVEGDNLFEFIAYDEAGNASETKSVTIVKDTTSPEITISGASDSDVLASNTDLTVTSEDADLKSWTAVLYKDSQEVGTFTMNDGETISTSTETGSNEYQLDVTAEDEAGNFTTQSITFTVDREAPEITISGTPTGEYTNTTVTPVVDVTPEDADKIIEMRMNDEDMAFESGDELTEDGSYELQVTAVRNGKFASTTKTFTIDKTLPTISVSGFKSSNTSAVTVNYSAADENLLKVTATIKYNGGETAVVTSGQSFSAIGSYELSIEAVDMAGNTAAYASTFTINKKSSSNDRDDDDDRDSNKKSSGGSSSSSVSIDDEAVPQGALSKAAESRTPIYGALKFEDGQLMMSSARSTDMLTEKITYKRYAPESGVVPVTAKTASDIVQLSASTENAQIMSVIEMKVNAEDVTNPETLIAYRYNEELSEWEAVGGFYDPISGMISFKTDQLGYFTAMNVVKSFADTTQSAWAEGAIETLASRSVISGYLDGSFRPNNEITRAEFAAILCQAVEAFETDENLQFADVNGEWYEDVLKLAVANGFMSGYNGEMRPNDPINREQMAVMIMNAFDKLTDKNVLNVSMNYSDYSDMSSWAVPSIAKADALGILTDIADETYAPKQNSTRAEAAVMVYKLLKALELM